MREAYSVCSVCIFYITVWLHLSLDALLPQKMSKQSPPFPMSDELETKLHASIYIIASVSLCVCQQPCVCLCVCVMYIVHLFAVSDVENGL